MIHSPRAPGVLSDLRNSNPGDGQGGSGLPCNGFPVPDYFIKRSSKSHILYEKVSSGGEPTAIGSAKRLVEITPDGEPVLIRMSLKTKKGSRGLHETIDL